MHFEAYLASGWGGAVYVNQPGRVEVEGVTFEGNEAIASGGALAFDWNDELRARTVWPERPAEAASAA